MPHQNIDYEARLREHGYRVTPQRLIILDAICQVGGHATYGQIHERVRAVDPGIDPSTIYRTLEVLCDAGLVVSAEIDADGKRYEIAERTPHHHLVCRRCGALQDLEHAILAPLLEQISEKFGFCVQSDHVVLHGLCAHCQDG